MYLSRVQKTQQLLHDFRPDVLDDHPVGQLFRVVRGRQHGREDLRPRDQDRLVNGERNFTPLVIIVYNERNKMRILGK